MLGSISIKFTARGIQESRKERKWPFGSSSMEFCFGCGSGSRYNPKQLQLSAHFQFVSCIVIIFNDFLFFRSHPLRAKSRGPMARPNPRLKLQNGSSPQLGLRADSTDESSHAHSFRIWSRSYLTVQFKTRCRLLSCRHIDALSTTP